MTKEFSITCEVTFLPADEGGPSEGFWPKNFTGYQYRPCIVFGDPKQRKAKIISKNIEVELDDGSKSWVRSDNFIDEPYIGVTFKSGPEYPVRGESFLAEIMPIAQEESITKQFTRDSTFTIREGARIVGFGRIV